MKNFMKNLTDKVTWFNIIAIIILGIIAFLFHRTLLPTSSGIILVRFAIISIIVGICLAISKKVLH